MDINAIGALPMYFSFLLIPAIIGIALLIINDKSVSNKVVFIVLVFVNIALCFISIIFLPAEYVIYRFAIAFVGIATAFSMVLRFFTNLDEKYSRYLLVGCLLLGVIKLFF